MADGREPMLWDDVVVSEANAVARGAAGRKGEGTEFYTPPLVAKTLVAHGRKALGIGVGGFVESPAQEVQTMKVDVLALLHLAKVRPQAVVSDGAVVAQLRQLGARCDYILELLAAQAETGGPT